MATVLATWVEPESAEQELMHARLASVLGAWAVVEWVSIDYEQGAVKVAVRLPDDHTGAARDLRAAWVRAKVLHTVCIVFAEDDLVPKRIRMVGADESRHGLPVRPRQGGSLSLAASRTQQGLAKPRAFTWACGASTWPGGGTETP